VHIGTLSEEDTEADAIARLLAPQPWSGIGGTPVGSGIGGTCVDSSCCQAHYYDRTPGFGFAYREAQWRVNLSGVTPGKVCATVTYFRREAGAIGAPWQVYGAGGVQVIVGAGGTGTSAWVDVPNDLGWETYAGNLRLCLLDPSVTECPSV
jgi:hypothetical protein